MKCISGNNNSASILQTDILKIETARWLNKANIVVPDFKPIDHDFLNLKKTSLSQSELTPLTATSSLFSSPKFPSFITAYDTNLSA